MSNLIFKDNSIRTQGNLVCLTDMAKPYPSKQMKHWISNDTTKAFLEALSAEVGIPTTTLLSVSHGKPTFGHPEVAIAFAQWLSPEFHVWCIKHLRTLMETGSTTIIEQAKPVETKLMVSENLIRLNESTLPAAVKQLLIDSLMNEYITQNQPVLEASKERWVGCVQKAEEMGYSTDQSDRAKLGKFVKGNSDDLTIKQEERLCNGMMRSIWVYLDSPELEVVIHDYFNPEVY